MAPSVRITLAKDCLHVSQRSSEIALSTADPISPLFIRIAPLFELRSNRARGGSESAIRCTVMRSPEQLHLS